ncbi:MAG TPA: alpha/beta hydrolase [Candidatus Binatia bacterium]|nr:alpha/beta hydrolase [Candidatus Binatia bacterium]
MTLHDAVPWLFLAASLWGAWFTYNGFRPMEGASRRAALSFFAGWLTTELALHHLAWQALVTAVFVWAGALAAWPGMLGLAVTLVSWVGLGRLFWASRSAEDVVEQALGEGLGATYRDAIPPAVAEKFAPGIDWRQICAPFPVRHPEVERVRDVVYTRAGGIDLHLDVYRHRSHPTGCPTLLQIHGGAWILGSKNEQGVPLMVHLASRGWVCVSVDYRLSPRATFPDHVIDLKHAIAWIREHGREYGADPDFLVVTGGSAGGHLSSLVALTPNEPEYQPGFEHVDTSVAACVAFYGVYDFTDRNHVWRHDGLLRLLERRVMKVPFAKSPDVYERASPIARVRPGAPPFFVIHGTHDTMVPVGEARHFVDVLRRVGGAPVVYAEIPGAQHAFELFPSVRTTFVVHGVERFLAHVYSQWLARHGRREAAAS